MTKDEIRTELLLTCQFWGTLKPSEIEWLVTFTHEMADEHLMKTWEDIKSQMMTRTWPFGPNTEASTIVPKAES